MNILFYHHDETCPTMGGIQRTTACIADGLTKTYGYQCFNIYDYENRYPAEVERYKYVESRHLPPNFSYETLAALIDVWKIDVVINQMSIERHATLKAAVEKAKHPCKLIYWGRGRRQK